MPDFGRHMHTQGAVLKGVLSETHWRAFLMRCALDMGMTSAGEPATYRYPMDGKGGNGLTIMQPITESFLVIDTWPDHDGAYLHISSCKPFALRQIMGALDEFGLELKSAASRQVLEL